MPGKKSYGRTITVHKRGFTRKAFTNKNGIRVKSAQVRGSTFREKDRGNPGKGPKLIPIAGKDDMNKIAREMGYASATNVPDMHIDSYVSNLVKRYGEQSVAGKLQAMINLRKNENSPAKKKFEMMHASLEKQFGGNGWTAAG